MNELRKHEERYEKIKGSGKKLKSVIPARLVLGQIKPNEDKEEDDS